MEFALRLAAELFLYTDKSSTFYSLFSIQPRTSFCNFIIIFSVSFLLFQNGVNYNLFLAEYSILGNAVLFDNFTQNYREETDLKYFSHISRGGALGFRRIDARCSIFALHFGQ